MKIEYSNEKSNYVKRSLRVKDEFDEEIKYPWLIWIPVIFLSLIALDYFTYGLRETISQFFPESDPTAPFIFGILFGVGYSTSVFSLFFLRRWSVYWTVVVMICEWFYFGGYNLFAFHFIDNQLKYYPMFGEGLLPWIDTIVPIYSLLIRQIIIIVAMLTIWRRLQ